MDNRLVEGINVILNCIVFGKLDLIIFWIVNGFFLDVSGNFWIFFMNDSKELIMMNLNKIDSGEY